ncbi:septum-promoting GTP-binding protein, putative [Entamoeba invadens IP1]|uniref:Septum-promoting GTP-binding protein, putative n=1 Tax=Entamoeba invadens IP1 TaxID=370355 RepID=A0A0A1TVW6_ENTIV|nr:septum-promoting GTP-binding protein, putative [Entamoeba invadens IP1]ELP84654.1 septum-promoting GTP-binding protein, putative [Entamoeba invadens IP1]|eukprot:XP_004184000.1 septum-promoting GTP-binding protein, putative [Entamoeba invadens IP1]
MGEEGTIKIAMLGDSEVGKTSLMVKYVEGKFNEDYIMTLGIAFMEKKINLRGHEITFSIGDLGGQREYLTMLPNVLDGAHIVLLFFDLTRSVSLNNVKYWYKNTRQYNPTASIILVGTKYDLFVDLDEAERNKIVETALKFANLMKSACVFCSALLGINVDTIFKISLSKAYGLKLNIQQAETGAVVVF